jgi:Asp-tRNA(Asn)/Glu-tRNA(Gln) amidotransferase B subunit
MKDPVSSYRADGQDTAKTQTIGTEVLIDLNRAGTGLMEIITEPDMRYDSCPAPVAS